jgi:hypothetical protein
MKWTLAMERAARMTGEHRIRSRVYAKRTDFGWTYFTSWAIRPHR